MGAMDAAPPTADDLLAHAEWLRRLASALVREPGAADDLVQDTLEVALTRPPREPGPVRPWLGGVLRNLARMRARAGARRARRESETGAPLEAPSPETLVARVQTQQQVARLVLELAEPGRSTLLLRYYEGLSAADIARAQGVPAGTVRWRLKQALDELRARLDDAHAGERPRWALLLAPLVGAPATGPALGGTLLLGGLAVKTSIKLAAVAAVIVALVVGTRLAGMWGGGSPPQAAAPIDAAAAARPVPPTPAQAGSARVAADDGPAFRDDDPRGPLRLEGQVIDEHEQPVGGARIAIDSYPARIVLSEADGSFVIDGLLPRDYRLEASAHDGYAGPAYTRLRADAEPVILRMRPGGVVEVAVTEARTGAPIAGAEVELRAALGWRAVSGADGVATLRGVGPAWAPLAARAAGYAPAAIMVGTHGDPAAPQRLSVALARGAELSGQVIGEGGAPIAGARVALVLATEPFPVADPRKDGVLSGADGGFRIPAVAAGTWRVVVTHGDHAPATTAPLILDGVHARGGVEIRLESGGVIAGVVQAADGTPVAAADVRVLGAGTVHWRMRRQAFTDGDGRFRIAGLPRRTMELVAQHDRGASAITTLDLAATREHAVTLTLAVTGAIAGRVVDRAGEPVGDAQVLAEPVWSGNVGEREAWQVRGLQQVLTDQGGAFRFAGLPDGAYRLRATRPGASEAAIWLGAEVAARTGDAAVTITVVADGRITGKVALADGAVPRVFTVSVGAGHAVPFASRDGAFAVPAPAGVHTLSIEGPGFAPTRRRDVVVEEAADADQGTITVEAGRAVSGRVLDAAGAPVAGAQVAAGRLLTGGGVELFIDSESLAAQTTETDADGRFVIAGLGPHPLTVLAGRADVGRSASVSVPRGRDSVVLDLVLEPTGGLDGTITRGGQPLADTVVIANPIAAASSNFFVVTGPDGSFALDALAAGTYIVYPMVGGGGNRPKDMYVSRVDVVAGERARVTIDATPGPIAVTVAVQTEEGAPVLMAPVLLVQARVDAPTMGALRDGAALMAILAPGEVAPMYLRVHMGAAVEVQGARPGVHTACAVPFPIGDDGGRAMAMQDRAEELPMKCVEVDVAAAPPAMTVTIVVPTAWTRPPPKP